MTETAENAETAENDRIRWLRCAVRDNEERLVRYVRRLTGNLEQARDIVQDAFLRLCRQDPERIQGQVVAWLYRVCRNRALDVLSKERRMSQLSPQQTGDCGDRRGDPTAAMERREDAALAAELLQQLPERQREVIRLKVEEELSYREIAEVLEISVSNVGFLLHVGFKTLRQRLGPRLAPGEP